MATLRRLLLTLTTILHPVSLTLVAAAPDSHRGSVASATAFINHGASHVDSGCSLVYPQPRVVPYAKSSVYPCRVTKNEYLSLSSMEGAKSTHGFPKEIFALYSMNQQQQQDDGGEDDDNDDNVPEEDKSPIGLLKKTTDEFLSSSIFTSLLFLTPFLSNPSIRKRLDPFFTPTIVVPVIVLVGCGYVYKNRYDEVSFANDRTRDALSALRDVKAAQLSGKSLPSTTEDEIALAANAYKDALQTELELRTIIPGLNILRITDFDDPISNEEDLIAVEQYLGLQMDKENGKLISILDDDKRD